MTSNKIRELKSLLSYHRSANQTCIAFDAQFSAQMSKFISMDPISALPECIAPYYLLDAANLADSKVIASMGAATTKDASLTSRSATGSFQRAVTYESVASVLHQCGIPSTHTSDSTFNVGSSYPTTEQ